MTETASRRPDEHERSPGAVLPGLLLVAADAVTGWLLYEAVGPWVGLALWFVALLLVGGMLADGVGRISRLVGACSTGRPLRASPRE